MLAHLFLIALAMNLGAAQIAGPASRGAALLEQVRHLNPEGRAQVIARMEIAVAEASPATRPALEDLLRKIKAIDQRANPEPAAHEPDTKGSEGNVPRGKGSSLERFRKLSPEQRKKVIAQMEVEAAKASTAAKLSYDVLLKRMRALDKAVSPKTTTPKATEGRIQASIDSFRQLDPERRAQVISQLEADARTAPAPQKKLLSTLIQKLKEIPEVTELCSH